MLPNYALLLLNASSGYWSLFLFVKGLRPLPFQGVAALFGLFWALRFKGPVASRELPARLLPIPQGQQTRSIMKQIAGACDAYPNSKGIVPSR